MKSRAKKIVAVSTGIVATTAAIFGLKKAHEYAAAPIGPKDCDYSYPQASDEASASAAAAPVPTFIRLGGKSVDASCMNGAAVFGVANVTSEEQVAETLAFAREHGLKITSAGQQHSMGGQSFSPGGIVLNMRGLNGMTLDPIKRVLKVQAGATWAQVQATLDGHGLSVKAMQSINIFTVGGTLSVNAHGLAHDPGQVAPTVRALRVMRADGSVVTASRTENAELFRHVLGGYGLFGVILEAELDVVPNEAYAWSRHEMGYADVPTFIARNVTGKDAVGLAYGRLAMSEGDYLRDATMHVFTRTAHHGALPALQTQRLDWFPRLIINFSKTGAFGRWTRTVLEKHLAPRVATCVSRNNAISDDYVCDVSRNQQMYDSMGYLKNRLPDTDILQEYFVPAEKMPQFIDGLRETVRRNDANLLNLTIRIVHKDTDTALPYAKDDRLAFVLYFNQRFNDADTEKLQRTTNELIDLAVANGGSFYLPYQLTYSPEQLRAVYPEIDAFFAAKRTIDPEELFVNQWYLKYGK